MKEWKAPEKEAQKMTRDGAVSVNLVTGETTYPSDRTPEQDHSASGDTAGAAGKVVDRVELHREQAAAKKKRRKQRRTYREGEAAAGRPSSRLQFSEADQATPELQGAIRKSDKAADRLDTAEDCGAELRSLVMKRDYTYSDTEDLSAQMAELQSQLSSLRAQAGSSDHRAAGGALFRRGGRI